MTNRLTALCLRIVIKRTRSVALFFRADGDDTPDGTGSNTRLAASSKSSETRHGEIYTTADNLRRQS
jgi:hypothetical protein